MRKKPQYKREILDKIARLERICSQDVGRGIDSLVDVAKGGLLGAARSIAEHSRPNVAIITGFFMPNGNPPRPETDGPIGCALLAASLIEVGISVRIVTDSLCYEAVRTAVTEAGIFQNIPFDVVAIGEIKQKQHSVASLLEFWKTLASPISHIISIERAGPGKDDIVHNMKGEDITAYTAPLHLLFEHENIISIGIGDGGNELGMGNISRKIIANSVRYGEEIACRVECDYLIVCGVSNWGASGIL
ncbi:MAG: glutamate cyclase domain-containing protein, partial [Cyanobacteria bacterium J06649_11]